MELVSATYNLNVSDGTYKIVGYIWRCRKCFHMTSTETTEAIIPKCIWCTPKVYPERRIK